VARRISSIPRLRSLEVFYFQILHWSLNHNRSRENYFPRTKLKDQSMKKTQLLVLALASLVVTTTHASVTGLAVSVVSYNPGTGYVAGYTNAEAVLGEPSQVNPYTEATDVFDPPYGQNQIVSIGAGGSLTVKFKTPILNHPRNPFGLDFIIFGNTGFIITNDFDADYNWIGTPATDGSTFGQNDGETRVSVSQDGKHFFVLNPALAPTVDGLYPTDGSGNFHLPVYPALIPEDFSGLTADEIKVLYNGSAGGLAYDISWAQNSDGRRHLFADIRYVRIEVLSGHSEVDAISAVFTPRGQQR
jgi:hypothetical protein